MVFGFGISAFMRAFVSRELVADQLGELSPREICPGRYDPHESFVSEHHVFATACRKSSLEPMRTLDRLS